MAKKMLRILLLALLLMGTMAADDCDSGEPCEDTTMGCPGDGGTVTPPPGCQDTGTGCQPY